MLHLSLNPLGLFTVNINIIFILIIYVISKNVNNNTLDS